MRARLLAELLGTLGLLVTVIGSGIMAERLCGGNVGLALLANALATVGGLFVLIEVFAPLSGAHFNPVVTLVMALKRDIPRSAVVPYIVAQLIGATLGAWLAHAMFELPILQWSSHVRSGPAQWLAEGVATFGLLWVILRAPAHKVSVMVAAYIGAAYWFTASTSFANPAAAWGRMFTETFAGIEPASAPGFVVAQIGGALLAWWLHRRVLPDPLHQA